MLELNRRVPALVPPSVMAFVASLPTAVLAHAPEGAGVKADAVPWSFEPWVVALLAVSMGLYALGVARLWRHAGIGRGIGRARVAAWTVGWITLVAALVSPLDPLGERLFSAHMIQHELLMVVAAPLLVLGRPLGAWVWALPSTSRANVGGWFRSPRWRLVWHAITNPMSAWSLHALALWGWHVPSLFGAALEHPALHALQHASFLSTALLFWWSTIGSTSRRHPGSELLSLFTTMAHTGALGALMTLSMIVWYRQYLPTSAALGIDALQDQQLGGLVMWIPAGLAYLIAGIVRGSQMFVDRPPMLFERRHQPAGR